MVYVPITYIPDGAVTRALKRHIKGRDPKPELGNLGPMLDENFVAARKQGRFRYHPDDLRFDVARIVKFTVLLAAAMTIGIAAAVLLGQDDSIALLTVATVLIPVVGAALFVLILARCVIHVSQQLPSPD